MTRRTRNAWDRLIRESTVAHAAFMAYVAAGEQRSIRKLATELGRGVRQLAEWSSKYDWVRRAADWDADQDRVFVEEMRAERKRIARQHARIAGAMLAKAVERLQSLDASSLSPRDLVYIVEVATKVERQAVGAGDVHEHVGAGGGPIQIEHSLPDDELEMLADLVAIKSVLEQRLGPGHDDSDPPDLTSVGA